MQALRSAAFGALPQWDAHSLFSCGTGATALGLLPFPVFLLLGPVPVLCFRSTSTCALATLCSRLSLNARNCFARARRRGAFQSATSKCASASGSRGCALLAQCASALLPVAVPTGSRGAERPSAFQACLPSSDYSERQSRAKPRRYFAHCWALGAPAAIAAQATCGRVR